MVNEAEKLHETSQGLEPGGDLSMERRDFLRLVGFTLGAVGLSGCSRGPAQSAFTLLNPDEYVVAGRSYWIATSSWADGSGSGILARCVDGRPIKLEGNPGHPVNRGGLTAACQAALLSLYDDRRFDGPRIAGSKSTWETVDGEMRAKIETLRAAKGRVRLLTSTITSPSTLAWIKKFLESFSDGRHVMYDALSCSAQLDAGAAVYGIRALPRYELSKAKILASFDADFLGTWVSPAGFTADWKESRQPDGVSPRMSRHWQFESRLSVTGARADRRVLLAPWETGMALAALGAELARKAGRNTFAPAPDGSALSPLTLGALKELAKELWDQRGASLVLCGRNDLDSQLLCCWINEMIGAPGATLDLVLPSLQRRGDDAAISALREELIGGKVDLLIVAGCNPAYELPGFGASLKAARNFVSLASTPDETSALANIICPEPHELERWDDGEPLAGVFTTTQPTLPALRSTRTLRATLARWLGDAGDDRKLLADHWRSEIAAWRPESTEPFEIWFARVLEKGWVSLPSSRTFTATAFRSEPVAAALERVARSFTAPEKSMLGLVLYPKVAILDGRGAHNPWLQELPDPISKIVWDNHADFAPSTAARLGFATGDVVRLSAGKGLSIELPVLVQPGQDPRVVAVALGYGRLGTDRFTNVGPQWMEAQPTVKPGGVIGVNATPMLALTNNQLSYDSRAVSLVRTGAKHVLACTQDHHSLTVPEHLAPKGGEVRDAIRVVVFPDLVSKTAEPVAEKHGEKAELWPADHANKGPLWGMAVDLAACTGCSACVVSCQAENNVPVVGRDEVLRHREMSWIRIDRYYAERADGGVEVNHQPMMCQHCGHAPCETVCPVLATTHSSEGLNQQTYNRCVGTRYCANNCPYKVRRFNWFDYARENQLQNMSLNPQVTIRSRGVMEKCSLCVQRIQDGKAAAKRRGEPLRDGEVRTACQQSCPAQAIVFGNLADPASEVSKKVSQARAYEVLGELNVQASVRYLANVRNVESTGGKRHG